MAKASDFEALRSGLAAMAPRWGLSEGAELQFLSHSENTTFLASDPSTGARLILRVHRIGYHTCEEIRSELEWIRALIEEKVVDTPEPIPDCDGAFLRPIVVDALKDRLARYGETGERFGLIHADLRLANLLVDGDRLGIIDFDDCGFSWFFYDFASAVSFFEHDPIVPELQHAWLAGYRTVAPVGAEDEAMMPVFVMLRRLLLMA